MKMKNQLARQRALLLRLLYFLVLKLDIVKAFLTQAPKRNKLKLMNQFLLLRFKIQRIAIPSVRHQTSSPSHLPILFAILATQKLLHRLCQFVLHLQLNRKISLLLRLTVTHYLLLAMSTVGKLLRHRFNILQLFNQLPRRRL